MGTPWYASLEDVKSAMDMAETARADALVARQIEAASRSIEALCHRRFYPEIRTASFAWPNDQMNRSWRLWLDANELISVTSLSSGGVAIDAADYFLEPQSSGPPYTRLELDLATSAAFGGGPTWQRDITVTGLFGYRDDSVTAGQLAAALSDTATEAAVTDSAAIGIGHLLRLGDERAQVTGKRMADTGQTLGTTLSVNKAAETLAVTDGTAFHIGETVRVDAERMLVVDIAATSLFVRRAWDGSTLAAHEAGAAVYAPRTLVLERGVLGTTAAAHDTGAPISRWTPPPLVEQLCIDEAIWRLQNTQSGMARTIGEGEGARQVTLSSIRAAREDVYTAHGRKARMRAI